VFSATVQVLRGQGAASQAGVLRGGGHPPGHHPSLQVLQVRLHGVRAHGPVHAAGEGTLELTPPPLVVSGEIRILIFMYHSDILRSLLQQMNSLEVDLDESVCKMPLNEIVLMLPSRFYYSNRYLY